MCRVLNITRQNYYKYRAVVDKDYHDYLIIKEIFEEGKQLYGARRLKIAILNEPISKVLRAILYENFEIIKPNAYIFLVIGFIFLFFYNFQKLKKKGEK